MSTPRVPTDPRPVRLPLAGMMLLPPVPKIAAPVGMTVLRSVRLSPPPGGNVPPPPPLPRPPGVQTGDAPGPGGT